MAVRCSVGTNHKYSIIIFLGILINSFQKEFLEFLLVDSYQYVFWQKLLEGIDGKGG